MTFDMRSVKCIIRVGATLFGLIISNLVRYQPLIFGHKLTFEVDAPLNPNHHQPLSILHSPHLEDIKLFEFNFGG